MSSKMLEFLQNSMILFWNIEEPRIDSSLAFWRYFCLCWENLGQSSIIWIIFRGSLQLGQIGGVLLFNRCRWLNLQWPVLILDMTTCSFLLNLFPNLRLSTWSTFLCRILAFSSFHVLFHLSWNNLLANFHKSSTVRYCEYHFSNLQQSFQH